MKYKTEPNGDIEIPEQYLLPVAKRINKITDDTRAALSIMAEFNGNTFTIANEEFILRVERMPDRRKFDSYPEVDF